MKRIYHNPRCSTSRKALATLEAAGIGFETVLYLKSPPSRERLDEIIDRLEDPPADLVRKDKRFKDLGLDAEDYVTKPDVVEVLLQHPELMQRPLIDDGTTAFIGRPLHRVDAFTES